MKNARSGRAPLPRRDFSQPILPNPLSAFRQAGYPHSHPRQRASGQRLGRNTLKIGALVPIRGEQKTMG